MNIVWIFALSILGSAIGLVLLAGFITNRRHSKPGPGAAGDDNWGQRYRQTGQTRSMREYGRNFVSSPQG